ncbi:MAG: YHS domain-containing protein [Planctomycetota bacterium]
MMNPRVEKTPAVTEQTTCPVMGGPINKDFFTVYNGKKVYFCCPGCKPEFEKNPEKYLAKLPQFNK